MADAVEEKAICYCDRKTCTVVVRYLGIIQALITAIAVPIKIFTEGNDTYFTGADATGFSAAIWFFSADSCLLNVLALRETDEADPGHSWLLLIMAGIDIAFSMTMVASFLATGSIAFVLIILAQLLLRGFALRSSRRSSHVDKG